MKRGFGVMKKLLWLSLFGLVLVACSSEEPAPPPTEVPTEVPPTEVPTEVPPTEVPTAIPTPEPTATPIGGGPVTTLEGAKTAVVQIEAQGTFRDPEVGTVYNSAGRGSGFIIDDTGLVVTNNHVVTGAALVKVWVGGESEARNARIVGVSECSDLALIDIEGDGFPYLEWYEGDIDVGLDVYAAGFPLGDPEYTLTRGIISKANADGETSWASVDGVVQHDATINPGNSGGALITADGQVVAVNYAGSADVDQYFAITRDEAVPVIEKLSEGNDYLSIGINGRAVYDDSGISGIWVSSVKSGSPADGTGIEAGDMVTSLEGLVLGTDGTMADYCDILRTHAPDDTMSVEVLRFDTQELMEGQLNGRVLEQTVSFAGSETEETASDGTSYETYVTVTDESGRLEMDVPAEWGSTNGAAWTRDDEPFGLALSASTDLDALYSTWSTPGVFFGATDDVSINTSEYLDEFTYTDCEYDSRTDYEDPAYAGEYDLWLNCGESDARLLLLAAHALDNSHFVFVYIQVVSDADIDAAAKILDTFIRDGE